MKLSMLVQLQEAGILKVAGGDNNTFAIVGGRTLSRAQCNELAEKLGWLDHDLTSMAVIQKTHTFINGIKQFITKDMILENTELTFQNRRKNNTESYFDRIKLVCAGKFDITILSGMGGVGGRYGIYSDSNNFVTPVKACRTLKEVGVWVNELI